MMAAEPTIRGVFVRSHINALVKKRGPHALEELEERYGKPIHFSDRDEVPVREEIAILEHIVDIISDKSLSPTERSLEAGKLHFKNFTSTHCGCSLHPSSA